MILLLNYSINNSFCNSDKEIFDKRNAGFINIPRRSSAKYRDHLNSYKCVYAKIVWNCIFNKNLFGNGIRLIYLLICDILLELY